MSAFKFWWHWFRLGRAYWSGRHLWTLLAWFESLGTTPARSVADEMQDWLREREQERVNPEDDGA